MKNEFIWHELMTNDLSGALDFYRHVLGLTSQAFPSADERPYHVLSADGRGVGGALEITAEQRAGGMLPFWVGYISSDDVDADVKRLQEAGGKVMRAAADIPHIGRFALVTDPQGAGFVLFKPTPPPGGAPPMATGKGSVGWNELVTSDAAAAWDFYAKMFGWKKDLAVDMGAMGTYQTFATGELAGGGMMNDKAKPATPCWRYVFRVESVVAAMQRVTDRGGKVHHGPHEVPGGDWTAHCEDAQGAVFGLVSKER